MWSSVLVRAAAMSLIASALVLCTWSVTSAQVGGPIEPAIALFRDPELGGRDIADVARQALDEAHLAYEIINASGLADPTRFNRRHFRLLVYTGGRLYPQAAADTIDSFLKAGGTLMTLGGPPLSEPAWRVGSGWATTADLPRLVKTSSDNHIIFNFEEDKEGRSWSRGTNSKATSKVYIEEAGSPAGKSLTLDIKGLIGWDTFGRTIKRIPATHDLVCFYAKGDGRTNQTAVELREKDGSRWIATVNIGADWGFHVLKIADFKFWPDSSAKSRGFDGDHVNLADVNQLYLGLSFTHTMVGDGDHKIWIDEVMTARNPLGDASSGNRLAIDPITPEYKLYPVKDASEVRTDLYQAVLSKGDYPVPSSLFSCSPRPQGTGYLKGRRARFIPLLSAFDASGNRSGYAAWMVVNGQDSGGEYPGAAWAVFGSADASWYQSFPIRRAIGQVASRLLQGTWLYEGGSQFYTYFRTDQSVKLGCQVMARAGDSTNLSVRVRVRGRSGKLAFEKGFRVRPGAPQVLSGQWQPVGFPDGDYTVTTELLRDGRVTDTLVHQLIAWSPRPKAARRFVTAKDGAFWCDGSPWHAHGVNYMPSSGIGLEDSEGFEYWLEAREYDPAVVEEDLSRIRSIGMNSVSVFIYSRSVMAMNLLDLLVRCERHGLKVNLSLRPHANPLDFNSSEVQEIVQTYHLPENDTVFAYDLAWERSWGFYEPAYTNTAGRKGYDSNWLDWIVERYGSVLNAERDWRFTIPKTAEGDITGPSDAMLRENGKWTCMVAAYRRFVDDLAGRKHGDAARFMRSLDPNHLVSFRMSGDAGDPTADPAAFGYDFRGLAKSMDIMEPEGYGRVGSWDRVKDGVFTAAYARYAAPDRPVLWAEFGKHAWTGSNFTGGETALTEQGVFFEDFYRMSLISHADGTSAWWYPGGFRVGENSDYGLLNPDGSTRPATLAARTWAPLIAKQTARPSVDYWIEVDRDTDVRGLAGIYEKAKSEFWKAIDNGMTPGLRDAGVGTDSTNTPLLAVGNTAYNGLNPPKYLNAELSRVEVRSGTRGWVEVKPGDIITVTPRSPVMLRATVGNTQVAEWIAPSNAGSRAGGVYLMALNPESAAAGSDILKAIPIAENTKYLADAYIEGLLMSSVTTTTSVNLQMMAKDRMWFGEKLGFTLEVQR